MNYLTLILSFICILYVLFISSICYKKSACIYHITKLNTDAKLYIILPRSFIFFAFPYVFTFFKSKTLTFVTKLFYQDFMLFWICVCVFGFRLTFIRLILMFINFHEITEYFLTMFSVLVHLILYISWITYTSFIFFFVIHDYAFK